MMDHRIVSHEEWLKSRKELLAKEKEFTHARDALSAARRELPWEKVEKDYVFAGPSGQETLADLFAGKSQLIIYHFMFHPDWDEGCKSCSWWTDNFNGIDVHLKHRDIAFLAVSRAPSTKLEAYKKRMGWSFKWMSSFGSEFNFDYGVSFTPEQIANGATINYGAKNHFGEEIVGVSVFAKGDDGAIYHTYSTYSRGVDILNGAYNYIDLTPEGRDEGGRTQYWVRRHDQYED
jgi:predicted dithiol-disulfide oxidoreductase (DUF899 family)